MQKQIQSVRLKNTTTRTIPVPGSAGVRIPAGKTWFGSPTCVNIPRANSIRGLEVQILYVPSAELMQQQVLTPDVQVLEIQTDPPADQDVETSPEITLEPQVESEPEIVNEVKSTDSQPLEQDTSGLEQEVVVESPVISSSGEEGVEPKATPKKRGKGRKTRKE